MGIHPKYTASHRQKCIELKKQGLLLRQIEEKTGIPLPTVGMLIEAWGISIEDSKDIHQAFEAAYRDEVKSMLSEAGIEQRRSPLSFAWSAFINKNRLAQMLRGANRPRISEFYFLCKACDRSPAEVLEQVTLSFLSEEILKAIALINRETNIPKAALQTIQKLGSDPEKGMALIHDYLKGMGDRKWSKEALRIWEERMKYVT